MQSTTQELINSVEIPAVPGLIFRPFNGETDYAHMVTVLEASKEADQLEWVSTVASVTRTYRHLENCDPFQDMIFVEVNGDVVGYGRCWWEPLIDQTRLYNFFAHPN